MSGRRDCQACRRSAAALVHNRRSAAALRHSRQPETPAGTGWLLPLLASLALSGCSAPVDPQAVSGFGNAATALVSSYQTGRQAVDALSVQQARLADAASRTPLTLLAGCDQMDPDGTPPALPACAVVVRGSTAPPPPTAVVQHLASAAPAFDALQAYAAALTAVTTAGDAAALNRAAQSMTAAACAMGKAAAVQPHAAAPATPPAAALAPALGTVLSLLGSDYLDQRRSAVLRDTVPAMDAALPVLGQTLEAALASIRAQTLLPLGQALRSGARQFGPASAASLTQADYQARRAALEAKAASFNQARAADPAATVAAMLHAHHLLALALQSDTAARAALLAEVQRFAAAAEQLAAAITAAARTTTTDKDGRK